MMVFSNIGTGMLKLCLFFFFFWWWWNIQAVPKNLLKIAHTILKDITGTTTGSWKTPQLMIIDESRSTDIGIMFLSVCCCCFLAASVAWIALSSAFLLSVSQEKKTIVWHHGKQQPSSPSLPTSSSLHQFSVFLPLVLTQRSISTCMSVSPSLWWRWARKHPALRLSPSVCSTVPHSQHSHASVEKIYFWMQ